MRSVILDFDRRLLYESALPQPAVQSPRDVLFRVHEVGVCGTDRELVHFRLAPREQDSRRIVIGHEALGQVVAVGSAVTSLVAGDWVVPTIRRPCPQACSSCVRGRMDLCRSFGYSERGIFNLDGYFTEFAVDEEQFLVQIPEDLTRWAVLLEPLSVVEKCARRIETLRQSQGRNALVLGLGPVGILAALVLTARGYDVTVYSAEAEDHPRTAILDAAGVSYTRSLSRQWDVIVEAAGSAPLALEALRLLGPCGVFVTLGAHQAAGEISFLNLIVGNQTIAGIVNASRDDFEAGARDLAAFPERALSPFIRRFGFADYRQTLLEPSSAEPKFVHRIADSLH